MKTFNLRQHKQNRQEHSGNFRDLFHNRKSMKIINKFCIQKLEESIMNNFVYRNKEKILSCFAIKTTKPLHLTGKYNIDEEVIQRCSEYLCWKN